MGESVRSRHGWDPWEPERLQPELPWVRFSVGALVAEVRDRHFPALDTRIHFRFARTAALAFVTRRDEETHIVAHSLLNHAETPREVMAFVIKHELLHLVVPPRDVDGRWKSHPPEFWSAETAMSPDGASVWGWVWMNFGCVLRRRPRLERTEICGNWRALRFSPRAAIRQAADGCGISSAKTADLRDAI